MNRVEREGKKVKDSMLGSRMRHQEWRLEIIWGKMDGKLTKGTQRCRRRLRASGVGGSSLSEAGRQEKAEGSVAWLAPLGGPGFKTKINLGEPEGRKERNKQTSRASAYVFSQPTVPALNSAAWNSSS